jgi:hypothetical protein
VVDGRVAIGTAVGDRVAGVLAASVVAGRVGIVAGVRVAIGTAVGDRVADGRVVVTASGQVPVAAMIGARLVPTSAAPGVTGTMPAVAIATQGEPRRPIVRVGRHAVHPIPIVHRPHRNGRPRSGSTRV